jgi:hypothetical protein
LESARRSHVNQFLGPEPQAIYAAASKHAHSSPAQLGGNLGSYDKGHANGRLQKWPILGCDSQMLAHNALAAGKEAGRQNPPIGATRLAAGHLLTTP